MKNRYIHSVLVLLFVLGCQKNSTIEGLWVITSVTVGEEEMTPNARWTRFNSDNTQESGNGRFQHSYGTWKLHPDTSELTIINSNGVEDLNEPFKVLINQNKMTWERTEEGQLIKVTLERSSNLPETYGDKVLGLWRLESVTGNGNYFAEPQGKENDDYLFFRWDKRFVIKSNTQRIQGVYNVHGHKPEVELIPYGDQFNRNFWSIEFEENFLTLRLLNTDTNITRKFRRIHRFPN